jgi:hypothetical protein
LHAQDGVFTLYNIQGDLKSIIDPDELRLEKIVEKCIKSRGDITEELFHRIRLPWRCAKHLLELLAKEGVSAATIFPGYRGVVKAMKEQNRGRIDFGASEVGKNQAITGVLSAENRRG